MNKQHKLIETRDWARMILMTGLALTSIILAIKGEMSGASLTGAMGTLAWLRG